MSDAGTSSWRFVIPVKFQSNVSLYLAVRKLKQFYALYIEKEKKGANYKNVSFSYARYGNDFYFRFQSDKEIKFGNYLWVTYNASFGNTEILLGTSSVNLFNEPVIDIVGYVIAVYDKYANYYFSKSFESLRDYDLIHLATPPEVYQYLEAYGIKFRKVKNTE